MNAKGAEIEVLGFGGLGTQLTFSKSASRPT